MGLALYLACCVGLLLPRKSSQGESWTRLIPWVLLWVTGWAAAAVAGQAWEQTDQRVWSTVVIAAVGAGTFWFVTVVHHPGMTPGLRVLLTVLIFLFIG